MASILAFQAVYFFLDGAIWVLAGWLFITRFFGYSAKPSSKRNIIMLSAVMVYDFASVLLYYFVHVKNGKEYGTINGLLFLFCIIYWMFCLREPSRSRRLAVILVSMEIIILSSQHFLVLRR